MAKAKLLEVVWPNPELEGSLSTDALTGDEGEGEWEMGISQSVPWSKRLTYQKQASQAFIERVSWEIQERRRLLAFEVREAFTQILALQEHLKTSEALIQIDQKLLLTMTARFQQGEVSQIELQVARIKGQQDLIEQKHLQSDLKSALLGLNLLLGRRQDATFLVLSGELKQIEVVPFEAVVDGFTGIFPKTVRP